MEFIKAFEDIDKDFSGEITREELTDYMQKKNYKPAFVEKWLTIFDADNSGTITLEEFCSTLGLVPSKKHKETITKRITQKQLKLDESTSLKNDDIEVIAEDPDIPPGFREFTINLCLETVRLFDNELEMAQYVKKHLDSRYNRCWHVVVGKQTYGCLVSHDEGGFIHIRARKWGIMMWQVLDSK